MKNLLPLLFTLLAFTAVAQQQKIYYNSDHISSSRDSAKYYILFTTQPDGYYKGEQHLVDGDKLMSTGYYSKIDLPMKNGHFTYYNIDNGKVWYEENYKDGWLDGESKHYYSDNGTVSQVDHYKRNGKDGRCVSYYENGQINRDELYNEGKLVTGKRFDEEGKEIKYTPLEVMPSPGFDLIRFLGENIKYPKKARRNGVQGRVIVKFVVNEEGEIEQAKILRGIGSGCDEEVLRVVSLMPKWNPGMQDGKYVKVYYTLPVSFKMD